MFLHLFFIDNSSVPYLQKNKQDQANRAANRDRADNRSGAEASGGTTASGRSSDQVVHLDDGDDDDDDNNQRPTKKRRRETSSAWKFFDKTNEVNETGYPLAKCKLCQVSLTCFNTTNMKKHMQRKHADAWSLDVKSGIQVILQTTFFFYLLFFVSANNSFCTFADKRLR